VVWEGRSREAPPYPDRSDFVPWHFSQVLRCPLYSRYRGKNGSDTDIVQTVAKYPIQTPSLINVCAISHSHLISTW